MVGEEGASPQIFPVKRHTKNTRHNHPEKTHPKNFPPKVADTPNTYAKLYNAPRNPPETGGKLGKAHDNW